jgi:hypothetical protein
MAKIRDIGKCVSVVSIVASFLRIVYNKKVYVIYFVLQRKQTLLLESRTIGICFISKQGGEWCSPNILYQVALLNSKYHKFHSTIVNVI